MLHHKTLAELSGMLKNKEISSVELTTHFLDRIDRFDTDLNSYICVDKKSALLAAQNADKALSAGNAHPLCGIPIAQKDIFTTTDMPTTCGSKMLQGYMSPFDADLVHQSRQAGMVMLGKTNMDEFAMGGSNENSYYGAVKNPWNHDKVPGGSSGGSSACVAARLAPCASGTDTGGSIRQPAAYTGITGIKPTYGRISRYGMVAFSSSLDQAGPMTLSAYDAAMLLNVWSGHSDSDFTSSYIATVDFTRHLNQPIAGMKIGVPSEFFGQGIEPDVARIVHEGIKQLEKLGATIKEVHIPHLKYSVPAYYIIAPSEASSNLARYDGVRYGYRCNNPQSLDDLYCRTRAEGFGDEVKRRILVGTFAMSSEYNDMFYGKAQAVRQLIRNDFITAFSDVDAIVGPTTTTPAFNIGEKLNDPVAMYQNDIYTISANLAGIPAMSVPCGFINGMPVGMQIIGNRFEEETILRLAHHYQLATDWHTHIPSLYV